MIKVLMVDDHALIREGLKKTLSGEPDLTIVGEANNIVELFKVLEQVSADIILLDITMPGESGLDALKELHQKYFHVPVLILTFHPERRFAVRALKAGASGYITKESATEELVQAGDLLRLPLLDHVIIGRRDHYSFADHGLIAEYRRRPRRPS